MTNTSRQNTSNIHSYLVSFDDGSVIHMHAPDYETAGQMATAKTGLPHTRIKTIKGVGTGDSMPEMTEEQIAQREAAIEEKKRILAEAEKIKEYYRQEDLAIAREKEEEFVFDSFSGFSRSLTIMGAGNWGIWVSAVLENAEKNSDASVESGLVDVYEAIIIRLETGSWP